MFFNFSLFLNIIFKPFLYPIILGFDKKMCHEIVLWKSIVFERIQTPIFEFYLYLNRTIYKTKKSLENLKIIAFKTLNLFSQCLRNDDQHYVHH